MLYVEVVNSLMIHNIPFPIVLLVEVSWKLEGKVLVCITNQCASQSRKVELLKISYYGVTYYFVFLLRWNLLCRLLFFHVCWTEVQSQFNVTGCQKRKPWPTSAQLENGCFVSRGILQFIRLTIPHLSVSLSLIFTLHHNDLLHTYTHTYDHQPGASAESWSFSLHHML